MTLQTRRTLKTLSFGWIGGAFAGFFLGWLLVPASLPVQYLTPIGIAGPFVGLCLGGVLVRLRGASPAQ